MTFPRPLTSRRRLLAVWAVGLAGAIAGVLTFVLDDRLIWYDEFAHFAASAGITLLLGLHAWKVTLRGERNHPFLFVLSVASLGLALAAVWEIVEWGLDFITSADVVPGLRDTIIDLALDLVGALVAGVASLVLVRLEPAAGRGLGRARSVDGRGEA